MQPFSEWVKQPFKENMDVMGVFLLTGLVIVSAFAWTRVLGAAEKAVAAVTE